MLDARLRPLLTPALDRLGASLDRAGAHPNAITLAGFAVGMAALPCLAAEAYGAALALLAANRLADGLDGAVARRRGITDLGGFLDIVCDFIFYASFVLGFALARPEQNALAAAALLTAFMGTASTFLAFAAIAAKRGLATPRYGAKTIYFLGGLTEAGETIAAFALFCLFPALFPQLALGFAALCGLTAVARVAMGIAAFRHAN